MKYFVCTTSQLQKKNKLNCITKTYFCLFPGPPGVRIDDALVTLYPIDKNKCHKIDPIRDISFQLFTR